MFAGASWVPMSVPSMTDDVAVPWPLQFLFLAGNLTIHLVAHRLEVAVGIAVDFQTDRFSLFIDMGDLVDPSVFIRVVLHNAFIRQSR